MCDELDAVITKCAALVTYDLNGRTSGSTLGMHRTVAEGGSTTNKDTDCGTTGQRRRACALGQSDCANWTEIETASLTATGDLGIVTATAEIEATKVEVWEWTWAKSRTRLSQETFVESG